MSLLDEYLEDTLKIFSECRSFRRLAVAALVRLGNLKAIEFGLTTAGRDSENLLEILLSTAARDLSPLDDVLISYLSISYARDVPRKSLERLKQLLQVFHRYDMSYTIQGLVGLAKCLTEMVKQDHYSGSRAGVANFACNNCMVAFYGTVWCVISGRHDPDLKASAAEGSLYTEICPKCKGPAENMFHPIATPLPPFDTLFLKSILLYEDDLTGDFSLTLLRPEESPDYNLIAKVTAHFMELYEADLPPDQKRSEPGRIHIFDNLDQFSHYLRAEEGRTAERDEATFLAGITNSVADGALSLSAARESVRQSIASRPNRFVKDLLIMSSKEYSPRKRYIHSALMHEAATALCDEPRQIVAAVELYDDALPVGEIEEAIQVLLNTLPKALEYRDDPKWKKLAPEIATRLALAHSDFRDFSKALEFINIALEHGESGSLKAGVSVEQQKDRVAQLERLNILGCILKDLRETPRAVRIFTSIIAELSDAEDNIDPVLHAEVVALHSGVLNNLALAHAQSAAFLESAEPLSPEQIALLRKLFPGETDINSARRKLADLMRDLELSGLNEAFELVQKSGNRFYQSRQLRNLAIYWRSRGKPEYALPLNEQSVELAKTEDLRSDLADSLTGLGITLVELKRPAEALVALRAAATEAEGQYYLQAGLGYRRRLSEGFSETFDWLVQVCADSGLTSDVFSSIERAKARTLTEKIDLQVIQPNDPKMAEKYNLYLSELRSLEASMWHDQPDLLAHEDGMHPVANYGQGSSLELLSRMRDIQRELVSFRNHLAKTDGRFALLSQESSPDLLERLTDIIGSRGVFLDMYVTRKATYIVVLRKEEVSICEIPVKQLRWLLRAKKHWLDSYELRRKERARWFQCVDDIGRYLGSWLWKYLGCVTDWRTADHVVISPHWIFHLLPLHLMQTDSNEYLCEGVRVSYVPNARALVRIAELPPGSSSSVETVSSQYADIPFSRTEVAAIGSLPGLSVHRIEEANVSEELFADRREFDVLHFSCHGIFGATNTIETGLAISPHEFLSFDQIVGKLKVKPGSMAVLSACETGKIFVENAEEYLGLPYAFLCAGCSTVISSLWHVPDISTALLMTRFYSNLATRRPRLESLTEAQKWIRESTGRQMKEFLESKGLTDIFDRAMETLDAAGDTKLFAKPIWWGAFCNVGAWA
ncbi:MAG: CHAT domain-containing protein [Thermoanaerobaculia bacterium]